MAAQTPQEDIQECIRQLRVMKETAQWMQEEAELEENFEDLTQWEEIEQLIDDLAHALAQELRQRMQTSVPTPPRWTVEENKIDDLIDEEDMEREIDDGKSFGCWYTSAKRNEEEVLHLLSEYYTDSVLEAAKKDDLHPLPSEGYGVSTIIYSDDQYVAQVHGGMDRPSNTLKVIRSNIEEQEKPYQFRSSLLNSSEPVGPWVGKFFQGKKAPDSNRLPRRGRKRRRR